MGTSSNTQVMTLVNSIIGVSILAMPFCYKQCGILLASLILIFINLMTRLSCHYLLKSAIMTKRKNFEFLAFHAFGTSGKTAIELCIILLMIGTCIAFFVVMGDLGPAIISSLLNMEFSAALRPAVLIGLAVFVVLPLGMLRNVDSLSFICTLSFLFYLLLVLKVFFESTENLFSGFWLSEVQYWRPAGILQCLPIFSMALSCQSQLFEVFDSVTNATLDRMNLIVKYAVDLCTALYISVGVLGYIAYYKMPMTGNLLMSFSESLFSEIIKLLFVLSVAVTFPLVIFPCRASLYSLLFKKAHGPHYELVTGGGNHIPEAQFKCITLFIITTSLIVGLLAPNIEIVLGLVGSTIGVIICLLFPPLQFIWICNKATTEKILAQAMCMVGLFIMIMGTYANLYLSDSSNNNDIQKWKGPEPLQAMESKVDIAVPINHLEVVDVVKPSAKEVKDLPKPLSDQKKPIIADEKILKADTINGKLAPVKEDPKDDKRVEPPIPIAPEVIKSADKISPVQVEAEKKIKDIPPKQPSPKIPPSSAQLLNEPAKIPSDQNVNQKSSVAAPNQEEPPLKANDLLQKPALESQKNIESNNIAEPAKQNDIKADQKVNSGQVSPQGVSDFVKSKPPLPILMQKEKSDDKKVEGDMLGNIKNPSEREKRDLFATNATLQQIDIPQVNIGADINTQHNIDGGFVKNVASSVNANQSCDKDKVPKTKQLSDVHNLQVEPNIKETVVENLPNKKEDFILAPAKLSDPSLMLDHKVSENEALKVHPESMMKPMLRELKAVKEKADRKK